MGPELLLALKVLDIAMVGLSAWQRYDQTRVRIGPSVKELAQLREDLRDGKVSIEDANRKADELMLSIFAPLDEAEARL